MTPRAPSWAFFLLPTRMGELLAGALLAVVGTQLTPHPGHARGQRWRGSASPSSSWPASASTRRCRGRARPSSCPYWRRWPSSSAVGHRPVARCWRCGVGAAVDRPALVRAVPLALAGARARRCPLGSARLDPALRRGGDRRRPVGAVVPVRRGSRPPQPLAGRRPRPQPGPRCGDGAGHADGGMGAGAFDPGAGWRCRGGDARN